MSMPFMAEKAICHGTPQVLDGHWTTEGLHHWPKTLLGLLEKEIFTEIGRWISDVLVDESAKIGEGCLIGPDVATGPGCVAESVMLRGGPHQESLVHFKQHHWPALDCWAMGLQREYDHSWRSPSCSGRDLQQWRRDFTS
ncbi:Hypothetical predicted protein [Olea europaea subsp. europaea]|uniref:Uncharacterized protein n=1 Tax=Olea europaea subsp. europaea TaxID=158383 RepID=A0A8S0RBB5_OLEEU|nr:Hypothetical predicted protein [Olea europaea subsp. europaea]